jgi:hypothetical protein
MSRTTIIKISISVFSLIALVLLYVFGGRVIEDDNTVFETGQADDTKDAFVFDPETLVYDGTGDIDFLEGVTLEGYNKEQLKKMVYIRISTGDSLSEKIIEYPADTDDGRVRSMRNLLLRNYNGPSIVLPDEMPTVTIGTVDHIADLMPEGKTYQVEDGFGNDVREHVQIDVATSPMNSAEMNYTFILENAFGDRAVAKADAIISDVPTTIILTDASVTLRTGEDFDPYSFILSATDADGSSIMEEVACDELETSTPGEYLITYELRGQRASLRVNVTE